MSSYEVKTPMFEGPFDLLLFFIRRDELDIQDIPISKVTKDFLAYTQELEKMNLEVASEFILVAATLMHIKAKMLLPRVEVDEEGYEIDPRDELVQHLLEYKKYKSMVGVFEQLEDISLKRIKRGNVLEEVKILANKGDVESELQDLDLYKLLKVYQKVLEKQNDQSQERKIHEVRPYPYRIADQKVWVKELVLRKKRVSFEEVIGFNHDRIAVIFNFLAILELLALQEINMILGDGFNQFWIEPYVSSEG